MATVIGVALTPDTIETIPADEAGSVTITTDGSADVFYTLDGSDPTGSANVLPAGQPVSASHMVTDGTVKLASTGSPTVTVAAYSPAESEATPAATNAHAQLQASIDAAEATADNAREMVLNRDDRLEAVEYTAAEATLAHASLLSQIQAVNDVVAQWQTVEGPPGKSAYEVAKANGFVGTEAAWLASLKGAKGDPGSPGQSAYEVARTAGYGGTITQWLATLKGDKGDPGVATNGTNGVSPVLGIGTVSTLAAGASATATVGGTQANPTLNLGLPQGQQGIQGVPAALPVIKEGTLALTGNLAASASGSYTVTIPDMGGTNYSTSVVIEGAITLLDKLTLAGVVSKTATTVVVRVRNTTSTTTLTGTTVRVIAFRLA